MKLETPPTTRRRCGALTGPNGEVTWRVWASQARRVELVLLDGDRRQSLPMAVDDEQGYFRLSRTGVPEGQRYAFRLEGGPERPDPCSLWQPDGVHQPSAVFRPEDFPWSDQGWKGVARQDLVFYELHVGTFTPEGTFDAVIARLHALRDLGVTAVEIMPVAQFPGGRNWGYDGVHPYAAQDTYGGPRGLQRLVDACHAHGLAVVLDVVYNHFGPEGNYLGEFGPYSTDRYKTPWGTAINYDGRDSEPVRDFVLDNARMWLEEFHFDGLRLDAVHALFDMGARHILYALQEEAEGVAARTGRTVHVVAESDLNDPRLLLPPERGGYGMSAQWADDLHHAAHAFLTGERHGYYMDYGDAEHLADVLSQPFLHGRAYSPFRGRKHGTAAPPELTGDRFVVCLQNHDQVGNRATGERLCALVRDPAWRRLAAAYLLLSPYLPLIFMGEEYGEENPFPFFCSFEDPGLIQGVREGRRREFADFIWQGAVPDPQAEATFARAKLSWAWPEGSGRAEMRLLYADLLAARRRWPALRDFERRPATLVPDGAGGSVLELTRGTGTDSLRVWFNLSDRAQPLPGGVREGQAVLFASEQPRYGGSRGASSAGQLLPFEVIAIGPAGWEPLAPRSP